MSVPRLLDDLQEEVAAVWGCGIALPGPDRSASLRSLADELDGCSLSWASEQVRDLARHLEVPAEESVEDRRARTAAAYVQLQRVAAWVRTFRVSWGMEVARARLQAVDEDDAAVARRPKGLTSRVRPIGVERAGTRLMIHGLDPSGGWVVLADEVADLDVWDPMRQLATSRLFQDRVRLADVLWGELHLEDQPFTQTGGRRVVSPSYYARPAVRRVTEPVEAELPGGRAPGWVTVGIRRVPDGWGLSRDGEAWPVAVSDVLELNLAKAAAMGIDALRAVGLPRGDGATLLAAEDALGLLCFPDLDPAALRWPSERVRERGEGSVLGRLALACLGLIDPAQRLPPGASPVAQVLSWWCTGRVQPLPVPMEAEGPMAGFLSVWSHLVAEEPIPDELVSRFTRTALSSRPPLEEVAARGLCAGVEGRTLLVAHLSALKRGVRHSEILPPAMSCWAFAEALAVLRTPGASTPHPLRLLEIPPALVRTAAVEPLCAWMRGGEVDEDVLEAVLWVVGSGDVDTWVTPGATPRSSR
ncbi:MAG: hypothetical protein KTR31_13665 [Myxococcales bacterium]|nr:hypothetical protein [Myxococcales bacterium]